MAISCVALILWIYSLPQEQASDTHVETVCGSCHFFPPPHVLPRSAWRAQIERMAFLQQHLPPESRGPSLEFDVGEIVTWYENRAPDRLPDNGAENRPVPAPIHFEHQSVTYGRTTSPGISGLGQLDSKLIVSNMANGSVHLVSWDRGGRLTGRAGHPSRVSSLDLDKNGYPDILIADLGDLIPSDKLKGRVLVALQNDDGHFYLHTLVDGIARVADARATDIDLDGDLDVLVAAFGFEREGAVYLLRNQSLPRALDFQHELIVERTGAVSVIPVDDLEPDAGRGFVVAFAQQHELVSVFYPEPSGLSGYVEIPLFKAAHPAWGTSHLAATDLDKDGDMDFLISNGDTLDDGIPLKPYHGVRWLENLGDHTFASHWIGPLYGANAAAAGDIDGDGDLDVVAVGFLPQIELPLAADKSPIDSVVWFEREGQHWIPWTIESNHPRHVSILLTDVNSDGQLDIVSGILAQSAAAGRTPGPSLELWINHGAASKNSEPSPSYRSRPENSGTSNKLGSLK